MGQIPDAAGTTDGGLDGRGAYSETGSKRERGNRMDGESQGGGEPGGAGTQAAGQLETLCEHARVVNLATLDAVLRVVPRGEGGFQDAALEALVAARRAGGAARTMATRIAEHAPQTASVGSPINPEG